MSEQKITSLADVRPGDIETLERDGVTVTGPETPCMSKGHVEISQDPRQYACTDDGWRFVSATRPAPAVAPGTSGTAEDQSVTEYKVTYFGLADLERDALLDLYADHAYSFAERHGLDTPAIGETWFATEDEWQEQTAEDDASEALDAANEHSARLEKRVRQLEFGIRGILCHHAGDATWPERLRAVLENDSWEQEMDKKLLEIHRDPLKYVEDRRREHGL